MDIEKQKILQSQYNGLIDSTTIIDCWNGWFDMLILLFDELYKLDDSLKIHYILSNNGLVIKLNKSSNEINMLIEAFERKSLYICELCGAADGKLQNIRLLNSMHTCCNKHK